MAIRCMGPFLPPIPSPVLGLRADPFSDFLGPPPLPPSLFAVVALPTRVLRLLRARLHPRLSRPCPRLRSRRPPSVCLCMRVLCRDSLPHLRLMNLCLGSFWIYSPGLPLLCPPLSPILAGTALPLLIHCTVNRLTSFAHGTRLPYAACAHLASSE